ncbi:MAG: tetratricopeptide repeat protein [Acidobacteria bacterium]|nr:tetratricopeptide repeat protein [Acidobacteriota bacterium]
MRWPSLVAPVLLAATSLQAALPPEPLLPPAADGADTLFRQARDLRYSARWFEAAAVYRSLIAKYPGSSRVPEATFWLAATLEQDQRWDEAASAYTDFIARYPDQRLLVREALLNRVRCWGVRQWDEPSAQEGLVQALGEDREEVRIAAALQLAKRKDARALPVLQEGLRSPGTAESCRQALLLMGAKPALPEAAPRFIVVRIRDKKQSPKDTVTVRVSAAFAAGVTSYLSDTQLREARLKGIDVQRLLSEALSSPKGTELFSLDDPDSKVTVTVE